jgi:rhomboid protease GluP
MRQVHFYKTLHQLTPRTWAISLIVAANVLVFVVMVLAGMHFLRPDSLMVLLWGANYGPLTLSGQWWRLITSMFLHFGIIHIGFNMYVLWQIGHFVEKLVGNIGLLVLYMVSGIGASIASLAWHPNVISAGASGAVFGVCGALLGFIVLRRDTIPRDVIKGLRSSLVMFVIYNVVFGMVVPQIDMAAHLGGFGVGIVCGAALSLPVDMSSVARRWQRNVLLSIVGGMALAVAFMLLPAPPSENRLVEGQIMILDDRALKTLDGLAEQWQQDRITATAAVQGVQSAVIPQWQEARRWSDLLAATRDPAREQRYQAFDSYLAECLNVAHQLVQTIEADQPRQLSQYVEKRNDLVRQRTVLFAR